MACFSHPLLYSRHWYLTPPPGPYLPIPNCNTKPSNCLLRHSEINCTKEEPPQPPAPPRASSHMGDVTCYIWARSPSELGPLIRSAEYRQIIITNTMAIIIAIIILLVLLFVPSYHLILLLCYLCFGHYSDNKGRCSDLLQTFIVLDVVVSPVKSQSSPWST